MLCVSVILVTLVVTQLLLPAFMGRLLFPLFRKNIRKVEADLSYKKTHKRVREIEAIALRIEQEGEEHIHEALDELIGDNNLKTKDK